MSGPRVVCIGVATLDAIVAVDHVPIADERVHGMAGVLAGGGVAATAAVTLARLGVPVAFVGRVADDRTGRWIRDDLAGEGVDVSGLALEAGRSPLSVVLVEAASGTRALAPYPGDAGPIDLRPGDLERCAAAAWVHVDHAGHRVVRELRRAGVSTPVSLDGGVAIDDLDLGGIDLYAPTEAALIARHPGSLDDALRAALGEGPATVVATLGPAGSAAVERAADGGAEPVVIRAPGFAVPPSPAADGMGSTLGAGDVFHGALLAGLVEGRPLGDALLRANATAALACRSLDGRGAIPTRDELDSFLAASSATRAAGAGR